MARPLTDKEKFDFNFITDSDSNVALVQVEFNGQETAAICAVNEEEGENGTEYNVIPLAILVTPEMFAQIKNPTEDE